MKEIIKRNPIDRTAARVVSKGTHFEFKTKDDNYEIWDTPPPTITPVPDAIKDLIGSRKGQLVVVGYLGNQPGAKSRGRGARLLVRCDCGRYEARRSIGWRKLLSVYNLCQFCEQLRKLKLAYCSDAEKDRLENIEREKLGMTLKEVGKL